MINPKKVPKGNITSIKIEELNTNKRNTVNFILFSSIVLILKNDLAQNEHTANIKPWSKLIQPRIPKSVINSNVIYGNNKSIELVK